jgi:hypothetical protein
MIFCFKKSFPAIKIFFKRVEGENFFYKKSFPLHSPRKWRLSPVFQVVILIFLNFKQEELPLKKTKQLLIIFLSLVSLCVRSFAATPEEDFADRFFEPGAHVQLAKTYYDSGQPLLAFMILERARASFFEPGQILISFDHLFHQKPLKEDAPEAVSLLIKTPESLKSIPVQESLVQYYLLHEDWSGAGLALDKLMELNPACFDYYLQRDQVEELLTKIPSRLNAGRYVQLYPQSLEATLDILNKEKETDLEETLAKAEAFLKTHPDKAEILLFLAHNSWLSGKTKEGENYFQEAEKKGQGNPFILYTCGQHLEKDLHQNDKALECYLKVYFLDPEFKDSNERLAGRIHAMANEQAADIFEIVEKSNFLSYLFAPVNPRLQLLILESMADKDPAKNKEYFLKALLHPYPSLRWRAVEILTEESLLNQEEISTLLSSPDPIRKGLALYIGQALRFPDIQTHLLEALKSPVQLLRFDAVSNLLQNKDPSSMKALQEQLLTETHPWMKAYLNKSLELAERHLLKPSSENKDEQDPETGKDTLEDDEKDEG